jgi:hypothetical protein
VEILNEVEPGTMVVRAGHQKLFPGARVMPIPSPDAPAPEHPVTSTETPAASPQPADAAQTTQNSSAAETKDDTP